ncbi:NADH-ubiquinone oxidoreductase-F iron-sulfur binding region domain-containing protein [Kitasatospora sp. MAP5-34]|uniref:NADH-ubiquinone oxidoreductase-F iron-sulfur binding region domain-containing protein n=1 Tax=Kitasatospora sp. MAP5-34 TaxID=3035102 RepID=UPI0024755CDB|nr:NADH-ubiquinone oxidoreductase-F iron-sulfur binding region domain-containing protein [Kitasatospora sp. MAP5-34]MDH6577746.1 NADH:ubiquinone oxidoreductase subunit F (NADH-binding) [Kitasatospora sp. MAP5-34]
MNQPHPDTLPAALTRAVPVSTLPVHAGPDGPYGSRLLHGWFATGGPAGLAEHLGRYGQAPLPDGKRPSMPLIHAVEEAGLTGRGGAAFPTGRKLRSVAERRGPAVVVVNGMESEPASQKDESLLHLAPHLVLDGSALAAAAVGAAAVHLCLPRSRADQVRALLAAVEERGRAGIDRLPVQVHVLPHHYVSSEETSLVRWLNGGEARPMATPPRPFEKGVDGRPTLVDNVETLAHLALIARYGPAWFRSAGRPDAPGTTLVTVSGAVRSPGVHEIPLGTPVGAVLELSGGPSWPLAAVLVGGFFGSWLPADQAVRVPFSKAELAAAGAGPGAGVLVALPHGACGLTETARVLDYLAAQSARQCGPCRFGLPAVAEDFRLLAGGRPDGGLMDRLRRRVGLLPGRGACRHPDGASRLAATALATFADDVRHHERLGPCPGATGRPVIPVPGGPGPEQEGWR